MICAGKRLQSLSGVLHSCNMARKKRSWSRLPVGRVLDSRRRFHGNFCPAIQLREAGGGHAMSYTPEAEEILCALSGELWATVA